MSDTQGIEPVSWLCKWESGLRQYHYKSDPFPPEWDDKPDSITPLYTADQLAAVVQQRDELEAENARLISELNTALQQVKTEQRLSFRDQVAELEQQRDELLNALEIMLNFMGMDEIESNTHIFNQARKAIAKVQK